MLIAFTVILILRFIILRNILPIWWAVGITIVFVGIGFGTSRSDREVGFAVLMAPVVFLVLRMKRWEGPEADAFRESQRKGKAVPPPRIAPPVLVPGGKPPTNESGKPPKIR